MESPLGRIQVSAIIVVPASAVNQPHRGRSKPFVGHQSPHT
jgi:hypothetical protein